jgi:micrococcal nuclease
MRTGSTQKAISFWLVALVLTLAASTAVVAQSHDGLACGLEPGPSRAVARVVDGATLALDDRSEVRLLGLLAPMALDAGAAGGAWPPETAAREALAKFVVGRSVALAFAGPRSDRWSRVLAHIFVVEATGTHWVQGQMVQDGHARVFAPPGGEACIEALLTREKEARRGGRGLWAHAAYQVRPADRPSELARYAGTFQLVGGQVDRVFGSRAMIVQFMSAEAPAAAGRDRGFRAVVTAPSVRGAIGVPRALVGHEFLVRGWIEARSGPEIEIVAAGQIETEGRVYGLPVGATPGGRNDERPAVGPGARE